MGGGGTKERLIDEALEPGVSVAGLALARGVNANQLRNWVKLRQRRQTEAALTIMAAPAPSAFIPVVEAAPIAAGAGHAGSAETTAGALEGVAAERGAAGA